MDIFDASTKTCTDDFLEALKTDGGLIVKSGNCLLSLDTSPALRSTAVL